MDSKGANVARVTNNQLDYSGPVWATWSPDQTMIAFSSLRRSYRNSRDLVTGIFVTGADGMNEFQLAHHDTAIFTTPTWSPDGQMIAFLANQGAESDIDVGIYAVYAGLIGIPFKLSQGSGLDIPSSWSPDGSKILFSGQETASL